MHSAAEILEAKAREYEQLAASHDERHGLPLPRLKRREHATSAIVFTTVAIVLREVAAAIARDEELAA